MLDITNASVLNSALQIRELLGRIVCTTFETESRLKREGPEYDESDLQYNINYFHQSLALALCAGYEPRTR